MAWKVSVVFARRRRIRRENLSDAIELLQNMKSTGGGGDNLTKNEPEKIFKAISRGAETTNNKKYSNSTIDENPITTTKLAKNQGVWISNF